MIKVVLVEDEYLIRERIKKRINWTELGFEICGEAENGEYALALIEKLKPHIAIVDINMPLMNGLDFSREVKRRFPGMKVIILTGYSSFEYARDALQAGAVNYLLKPVDKEELTAAMKDLKNAIENEIAYQDNIEKLRISSRENEKFLRERFIQSLLSGEITFADSTNRKKFSALCPEITDGRLLTAVIGIDLDTLILKESNDIQIWTFAVRNIFEEIFMECGICCISYDYKGRVVLIINFDIDNIPGEYEQFIEFCMKAKEAVRSWLKFNVSIGVGGIYDSIEKISVSHKEADIALKNRLILGGNKIIEFNSIESPDELENEEHEIRQNLLINLRVGNTNKIQEIIQKCLEKIRIKRMSINILNLVIYEIILAANEFANENKIKLADVTGEEGNLLNPGELIEEKGTLEEIGEWLINLFFKLLVMCGNKKISKYADVVERIIRYIDNNYYDKNLSLDILAKSVFLSSPYISNIFSKETEMSITEYITEKRIRKAKELLDAGNIKVETVADMVGYEDTYYFSKCFKKYFGVPVSKYIKTK